MQTQPMPRGFSRHVCSECFALVRGIALHAILQHRHAVGHAAAADPAGFQYDLVCSVATVYEQVRSATLRAMVKERARHRLLARQMRAAGLPYASCYGPNGPLTCWSDAWLRPGVASTRADGSIELLLLPVRPPRAPIVTDDVMRRRLVPRPDWAPPSALGADVQQAFLSSTADGGAWGAVIVRSGDAGADLAAGLVADLAAPMGSFGMADRSVAAAELTAAVAVLEYFASQPRATSAVGSART